MATSGPFNNFGLRLGDTNLNCGILRQPITLQAFLTLAYIATPITLTGGDKLLGPRAQPTPPEPAPLLAQYPTCLDVDRIITCSRDAERHESVA